MVLVARPAAGAEDPAWDVLLFGFEPFDVFEINPTAELTRRLVENRPERRAAVLSVEPEAALGRLFELMAHKPRVILGFGVRIDLDDVEINTAATNWMALRSEAAIPYFGAIDTALPTVISPREPWMRLVQARLRTSGVPHTLSPDPGLHACNLTYFQALVHAEPMTRVLFIHVSPDVMTRPGQFEALQRLVSALLKP